MRVLAPYWWHVGERPFYDLDGNLVEGLFDFENHFVVTLEAGARHEEAALRLLQSGLALRAEPNGLFELLDCDTTATPNDGNFDLQWPLHNDGTFDSLAVADVDVNMPEAWGIQAENTKTIAIVDTGFRKDHNDLSDNYLQSRSWSYDGSDPGVDGKSHGTKVAGIAGAATNNGGGVGMASPGGSWGAFGDPRMSSLKIDSGTATANVVAALDTAAAFGDIRVVNMSIGFTESVFRPVETLRTACRNAYLQGILLVAATGNSSDQPYYPAGFDGYVLGVGHVLRDNTRNPAYSSGFWVDVVAPGGSDVYTTNPSSMSSYSNDFDGTSSCAPLVSGIAALLWSLEPSLTNDDIPHILEVTAVEKGVSGWDPDYGWGMVRADSAMKFVACERALRKDEATGVDVSTFVEHRTNQLFRNVPGIDTTDVWVSRPASVYRVEKTVSFPAHAGPDSLGTRAWARPRFCTTWQDTSRFDYLWEPPFAMMEDAGASSGKVHGFVYKVWDADSTSFDWYPFDPTTEASSAKWYYSYTIPVPQLRSGGEVDPASSGFRAWAVTKGAGSRSLVVLGFGSNVRVELFDVRGASVSWNVELNGREHLSLDGKADRVPPGIYLVRISTADREYNTKLLLGGR